MFTGYWTEANADQIRIVADTHEDIKSEDGEAPKKKKKKKKGRKPHRGYAFIVYEREKDMKSNSSPPPHTLHPGRAIWPN